MHTVKNLAWLNERTEGTKSSTESFINCRETAHFMRPKIRRLSSAMDTSFECNCSPELQLAQIATKAW